MYIYVASLKLVLGLNEWCPKHRDLGESQEGFNPGGDHGESQKKVQNNLNPIGDHGES